MIISAKKTRFTAAGLVAFAVIVRVTTCKITFATSSISHIYNPPCNLRCFKMLPSYLLRCRNMPTYSSSDWRIIVSSIVVLLIVSVFVLRFVSPSFRYSFDVIYNCRDSHVSYVPIENGPAVEYIIPLPSSSAIAYRLSDTAVVYCTKQNYTSFFEVLSRKRVPYK